MAVQLILHIQGPGHNPTTPISQNVCSANADLCPWLLLGVWVGTVRLDRWRAYICRANTWGIRADIGDEKGPVVFKDRYWATQARLLKRGRYRGQQAERWEVQGKETRKGK